MDIKAIQSQINLVNSKINQLSERNYFTAEEEMLHKPLLEKELNVLKAEFDVTANIFKSIS